jgi:hypothetical protein
MPKIKKLTPISTIAVGMKEQTEELYDKTPSSTPPVPTAENVTSADAPAAPEYKKPGRKKDNSIIPRVNGKLIFFEERHNRAVEEIHWQCKIDRQDVIRTALNEFLKRYTVGDQITPEGAELIRQYVRDTHV